MAPERELVALVGARRHLRDVEARLLLLEPLGGEVSERRAGTRDGRLRPLDLGG